ncbi:aminotransferase class I/II-fold pyridoxal phosphate-dependent enzyme [Bacillus sp. 31A1R]|uniref:Aminotransferase class I/II-fold pyridoxal phosphate-dependent enzyme n=1 Tax=Robertmurraya mangrovi TaxID=3098077 RepID=A0ABU5ITF6_9BACI|nr:aminotransferase class I/II-fold pyridoxal phosphate-dependent enzyme [Bacillus sp. 31A1R]MDZ5470435.1 aminotransferase class I/II-fold pyridoxal phosphate-dependent enzyme [Bacillus sp. 31A1R]
MNHTRIHLSIPHMSGKEQKYIKEAFETNWIAPLGPNVEMFEKGIASYVGVEDAVAVSSGTAAIHLALELLNVKRGDKVFCSTLTFVASANPILYQGAEPVFIDSESDTWNMSPIALERALENAVKEGVLPKAIIVVHLYGQSAKMEEIMAICNKYKIPIIEDSAESLGSLYKGKPSGTLGEFGIYSFNGNKIITTSGGGMIVSNNKDALKKARFLATQARDSAPHYQHSSMGYNYRLSNILAGVGRGQLEVLDKRISARRKIFNIYKEELSGLPGVSFMKELENTFSNRWLTTFTIDPEFTPLTSQDLIKSLDNENIEARPVWKPLHLQPLFQQCNYFPHNDKESISDKLFNAGVCLPSSSNLDYESQKRVIQCIKNKFKLRK